MVRQGGFEPPKSPWQGDSLPLAYCPLVSMVSDAHNAAHMPAPIVSSAITTPKPYIASAASMFVVGVTPYMKMAAAPSPRKNAITRNSIVNATYSGSNFSFIEC